jgi:hypothetical protein
MVTVDWVYIGVNTYSHFPHGWIEKGGSLETPTYHNILGGTFGTQVVIIMCKTWGP